MSNVSGRQCRICKKIIWLPEGKADGWMHTTIKKKVIGKEGRAETSHYHVCPEVKCQAAFKVTVT